MRVVFDPYTYGVPIDRPPGHGHWNPACDFGKLLAHTGGREQYVVHRLHLLPDEMEHEGVYYEKITYDQEYPAAWDFE